MSLPSSAPVGVDLVHVVPPSVLAKMPLSALPLR